VFSVLIGSDDFGGMGVGGLHTIAAATGGKVFTAGDNAALATVFHEIDGMQKAKFKQVTADWVDDYAPLAVTGLSAALLLGLALLGLRYTPW
jgi:hypothetical protein